MVETKIVCQEQGDIIQKELKVKEQCTCGKKILVWNQRTHFGIQKNS